MELSKGIKLNLGSGSKLLEGYINLDIATGDSIYPLEEKYHGAEIIRASHVLEHFDKDTSIAVLCHWFDALASGGLLRIAVPDFKDLVRRYQIGENLPYEDIIMGGQCDQHDYHKSLWDFDKLRFVMENIGFVELKTWQSEIVDCAVYPFSLNIEGRKP